MLTTQIAQATGVTAETVRFYTRKGLIVADKSPTNGYKRYDNNALQRLKFITRARAIGFSLKEIEQIIALSQQGSSPCPKVRSMLNEQIAATKHKINNLVQHLNMMEETYAAWSNEPDMDPDDKAICCLIEDWSNEPGAKAPLEQK